MTEHQDVHSKHEKIKSILIPGQRYTRKNKALCFLEGDIHHGNTAGASLLGKIQDFFKRRGKLYYLLVSIFAPVYPSRKFRDTIKEQLARHGHKALILNLGSGPQVFKGRRDIINVDIFAFDSVDMVADATNLPIEKDSADLVINMATLEHVSNPELMVREMLRVIKPGGRVLAYLPFIVPFHAAPNDFQRWSKPGLQHLFHEYEIIETGIGAGPTSGMLYVLLEWLAIALSLGIKSLHDLLFMILMVICAPIKLLDILLVRLPDAEKTASGFYILAEKKSGASGT